MLPDTATSRPRLPDRIDGETNAEWCRRAADSIPPEWIVTELVRFLDMRYQRRRNGLRLVAPAWSVIGQITSHGSGVSSAIVRKYLPDCCED